MNKINDGGPAFPVWELNGQGKPEMTGFGMTLREHISSPDCWCEPELDYKDPDTGAEVWVHRGLQ